MAKVSEHFDGSEDIDFWAVDLEHPDRILSVEGDISAENLQALAQKAGYVVQPMEG